MNSNFSFMKDIDGELYEKLIDIESAVKINPFGIGNNLRQVLEKICSKRVEEYNLLPKMTEFSPGRKIDLSMELFLLSNGRGFIDSLGIPGLSPFPDVKVYLTRTERDGKKHSRFINPGAVTEKNREFFGHGYNFLRQIGNEYSHNDPAFEKYFERSYENVIYALEILQEFLKGIYGIEKNKVPPFNEDIMPIGNYAVTGSRIPPDVIRTGCEREYTALRYEDLFPGSVGTSLIRQYPRSEANAVILRRASEVYGIEDNCGPLLNKVTVLSEGRNIDSPFYLIAYDFRPGAEKLSEEFLSTLSVKEKYELCLSYAKTLSYFHNNTVPVYHRILSSECAYYADNRSKGRGISTAIIKFEFAKIADADALTVIGGILPKITESDNRYVADEWYSLANAEEISWARADIYSLGILFADILMGSFGKYRPERMGREAHMRPILPLLEDMTGRADLRPDINKICAFLEKLTGELK